MARIRGERWAGLCGKVGESLVYCKCIGTPQRVTAAAPLSTNRLYRSTVHA
jgi:hypothetical protein